MGRLRVKEGPPGRGDSVSVLVSPSHHKTSRLWTLAQDIILEWEQRKKRRFGGGAPCESRKPCKTVTCHAVGVAEPVHHQAPLRGRWRSWRRWRRNGRKAGPWEVRFANLARQSFAHFVSHYVMTPLMIRHYCGCTSSGKSRTLQVRAEGLFVLCECDNFLLVPVANVSNNHTNPPGKTSSSIAIGLSVHCFASLQSFLAL